MSSQKKKLIIVLTVIAAVTLTFLATRQQAEPKYNGCHLSYWVDCYRTRTTSKPGGTPVPPSPPDGRQLTEARKAIRAIGTNALPFLLNWMSHQPPIWQTTLTAHAPRWAIPFLQTSSAGRAGAAANAIHSLGTNAIPAIPALAAILDDYSHPLSSRLALEALSLLGPEALSPLLHALTNAPAKERIFIQLAIMNNLTAYNYQRLDLPVLQRTYAAQQDTAVSRAASNAIWRIDPAALTNRPAQ